MPINHAIDSVSQMILIERRSSTMNSLPLVLRKFESTELLGITPMLGMNAAGARFDDGYAYSAAGIGAG